MDRFLYRRGWRGAVRRAAAVMLAVTALSVPAIIRHGEAQPVLFSLLFPRLMEGFPWYAPYETPIYPDVWRGMGGAREVLL